MARIKAKGKWIAGLNAETPLVEAAEQYLSVRLSSVVELLPDAAQLAENDVEYVHQLRVATRRSDAALVSFRPCVRKKTFKRMRKSLRVIRRAAAGARCCDVHHEILAPLQEQKNSPDPKIFKFILKAITRQRAEAQKSIIEASENYPAKQLQRDVEKLVLSLDQPLEYPNITLFNAAQVVLPKRIQKVKFATNVNLEVISTLHQLRLSGKKLRYALEIFAPCYDEKLKQEYYPVVEQLQKHLGHINDSQEIMHRLIDLHQRVTQNEFKLKSLSQDELLKGIARLAESFEQECTEQQSSFLKWWQEPQVASTWDHITTMVGET